MSNHIFTETNEIILINNRVVRYKLKSFLFIEEVYDNLGLSAKVNYINHQVFPVKHGRTTFYYPDKTIIIDYHLGKQIQY